MEDKNSYRSGLDIAIIGMTGRFPGAPDIEALLHNLKEGKSGISTFTDEELLEYGISKDLLENPNYVKAKGIIEDAEYFDSQFFEYTPSEAQVMDPQMRVLHECVWEVLETAGYVPQHYEGLVGIYVGGTPNPLWEALTFFADDDVPLNPFTKSLLNDKDLAVTRISYKLNLRGPSMSFFTSCSTSLVAIHTACQALLSGECDIAIAGGVCVSHPQKAGYLYQEGMHLSPDGYCRSFEAGAKGLVISDAVGLVVLKRVEDAIADNDSIDALIIGSAINNDGNRKVGYTAPSVDGQEEVISLAQKLADITPEEVDFLETHGSATPLGDSIELEALRRIFPQKHQPYCAIGTCKTKLGHTNSASGVVGLIKAVLGIQHKIIFPHINFQMPHPGLELENSPFYITKELKTIESGSKPLIAGVSSFGVGGTNAHIILKEAPRVELSEHGRDKNVITLSAKTETALKKQKTQLLDFLKENPLTDFNDLAYTLQLGRGEFAHRTAFVANNVEDIISLLDSDTARGVWNNLVEEKPKCVFMFTGQGKQYINMGRELYNQQPFFKAEMDRCFSLLEHYTGTSYKRYLYPSEHDETKKAMPSDTSIVQPLLFCFEYSLATFLMHMGILPHAMIGYSFGEIAAACLAEVLSLADAIKFVALRGELMKNTSVGAMISIPLPEKEATGILSGNISVAVDNGESCIVSGPQEEIEELVSKLKSMRIVCIQINGEHMAHSSMLSSAAEALYSKIRNIEFKAPRIPFISCTKGDWIAPQEAASRQYWTQHMLKTIKFYDGIKKILEKDDYVFIEIGAGRDLSNIVQRCAEKNIHTVDMTRAESSSISDNTLFLNRIGYLWSIGTDIKWNNLYLEGKRGRLHLPTYPFEKQSYKYRKNIADIKSGEKNLTAHSTIKQDNLNDWFYIPSWRRMPLAKKERQERQKGMPWVLLAEKGSLTEAVYENLAQSSDAVIFVEAANEYEIINARHYRINISHPEHYHAFLERLRFLNTIPHHVINLLPLGTHKGLLPESRYEEAQSKGLYSLLYLLKAFHKNNFSNEIKIMTVTDSMQNVLGNEKLKPEYATVLGTIKVINQEYVNISCISADIQTIDILNRQGGVSALLDEFNHDFGRHEVAYRGDYRWIKVYEPFELQPVASTESRIRKEGTYVITGGLGRVGYELASHLLRNYKAKIAIIARTALDEGSSASFSGSKRGVKLARLKDLEELGSVRVFTADVCDMHQMEQAIEQIEKEFGSINGLIHAAGITGKDTSRSMSEITIDDFLEQFKPKVYGTCVVDELFSSKKLDFCLLLSSLSPILGGLGYGGYAAGNSFLDAFVYQHNRNSSQPWICVNWETWISESDIAERMPALGNYNARLSMSRDEGIETFERILKWVDCNQIIVSSGPLEDRIQRWMNLEAFTSHTSETNAKDLHSQSRPRLLNPYVEPGNALERRLCELWQALLGIRAIGIEDNFFELGGDSLQLLNAIGALYKEFNLDISVTEFFNNPTIKYIVGKMETGKKIDFLSIPPSTQKEYYLLSSAQKRIFYLQTMSNMGIAYNETTTFLLEGRVDREKLESVFRKIIERHEILRTSFAIKDNQPVQLIHHQIAFQVEYTAGNDIDQAIKAFVRPFDLSNTPLIRVGLIQIDEEKYVMVLDMHHIITDGVSEGILVREFMALYNNNNVSAIAVQYKDYAEWQAGYKNKEHIVQQETYWLEKFKHGIPLLNLPYDFRRPALKSFAGKSIDFKLAEETTFALKALSQQETVTLYMTVFAAFIVLLSKISGDEDIVVGTDSAGRTHPEIQDTIGMFVNTLVLRSFPEGAKQFRLFLQELKKEVIDIFENQDYQFDDLVDKLGKNRDFSRNPIFDVLFVWLNMDIPAISTDEIKFIPYEYHNRSSKFELTLMGYEINNELCFIFEYSSELFKESTILSFIEYFRRILASIVKNPEQQLLEMRILSQKEHEKLIFEWNAMERFYPHGTGLHRRFEDQVAHNPSATAITYKHEALTYAELNYHANQLARYLRSSGVQVGSLVGLAVERSLDMVIGILGILKAGGAYVPLDPGYPKERLRFSIEDAQISILLTQHHLMEQLPSFAGKIVCLDTDQQILAQQSGENLPEAVLPEQLAYVIYTSGSTGQPKGVLVNHEHVFRLFTSTQDWFGFTQDDVWTLFHSYAFDFSVWEIWGALLHGGTLVIVPYWMSRSPQDFYELLQREHVTVLNQTPSAFRQLQHVALMADHPQALALRYVIFGGEALELYSLKPWFEHFGDQQPQLVNMYGITETTVHVTYRPLFMSDSLAGGGSVIGRGLPDLSLYVLDRYMRPSPIGVVGELYVGGRGVTYGYLNRAELTAERFIPDPFSTQPGVRLYRTGDLARYHESGDLEYMGRIDEQVKIHGFRIEPKEIEMKLLQHPLIENAVVLTRMTGVGEKYLCAYYTSRENLDSSTIKEFLSHDLPYYMIPAHFVRVSNIPLTLNGKVDREALPDPEITKQNGHISPRNHIEEKLIDIWGGLLNIAEGAIGIDQNFFEIGGNSLNIIQVSEKIKEALDIDIPAELLFQYTTVRSLADYVNQSRTSGGVADSGHQPLLNTESGKQRLLDRKRKLRG